MQDVQLLVESHSSNFIGVLPLLHNLYLVWTNGHGGFFARLGADPKQKTPFPNNLLIVACIFVAAGMCLPIRWLAMDVS
jgi:hypothetical protein